MDEKLKGCPFCKVDWSKVKDLSHEIEFSDDETSTDKQIDLPEK